jgi:hypothetical protein
MPDLKRSQSKLSFTASSKRARLDESDPAPDTSESSTNITVSASLTATVSTSTAAKPAPSQTLQELKHVTKQMAMDTLRQLRDGYKARSSAHVPTATTNSKSCILVQKVPNRDENGYIQIPPVGLPSQHKTGSKTKPQNAHRLVIMAYKSAEEIKHLLEDLWHASHRCHEPTCINPDHLEVEPKDVNEDRKGCKGRVDIKVKLFGRTFMLWSKPCPHNPPCIADVEERTAEELI